MNMSHFRDNHWRGVGGKAGRLD